MLLSPIVSTDLLNMIEGRDFYMCLANIAIKNKEYRDFYKAQRERGAFVLLDNGAAEKDQMNLEKMLQVIKEVNPNEVILNDCLMDRKETIKSSLDALEFYKKNKVKCQFMFVPQGKNLEDWKKCFNEMPKQDISTIGVSKFVTSGWEDRMARFKCCEYLNGQFPVHLLGCHNSIFEVKYVYDACKNIRSNDTAIAYIYAQKNEEIFLGDRPEGEIDFIVSNFDEKQKAQLEKNIRQFDHLIEMD